MNNQSNFVGERQVHVIDYDEFIQHIHINTILSMYPDTKAIIPPTYIASVNKLYFVCLKHRNQPDVTFRFNNIDTARLNAELSHLLIDKYNIPVFRTVAHELPDSYKQFSGSEYFETYDYFKSFSFTENVTRDSKNGKLNTPKSQQKIIEVFKILIRLINKMEEIDVAEYKALENKYHKRTVTRTSSSEKIHDFAHFCMSVGKKKIYHGDLQHGNLMMDENYENLTLADMDSFSLCHKTEALSHVFRLFTVLGFPPMLLYKYYLDTVPGKLAKLKTKALLSPMVLRDKITHMHVKQVQKKRR
ncbi:MAG: hypothetical protein LBF37_00070 [Rickettsiales bacterium]|jgi:hypothetical protein|nr:hypothetical protein [Rickettsiales bacterium]